MKAIIETIDVYEQGFAKIVGRDELGQPIRFNIKIKLKDETHPIEEQNTLLGELPYKVGQVITLNVSNK